MWQLVMPAALGLILATPVATWWLVGPLNTAPARVGLDYTFRPWPISPVVGRAAGLAATAVAIVSLAISIWATIRRLLEARWWLVLLPLLAAGFIAGAGWRVMTAGVLGSNIGAGFVVLFGWPLAAFLVAFALGYSFHIFGQARDWLPTVTGTGVPYPMPCSERNVWGVLLAMVALFTVAVWIFPS
jgi:hypothetical protein